MGLTKMGTSICLLQMENGNSRLPFIFFINWKRKFVFLGWQMTSGNLCLLCEQTCPSMCVTAPGSRQMHILPLHHVERKNAIQIYRIYTFRIIREQFRLIPFTQISWRWHSLLNNTSSWLHQITISSTYNVRFCST
jgi:hypothetical protein